MMILPPYDLRAFWCALFRIPQYATVIGFGRWGGRSIQLMTLHFGTLLASGEGDAADQDPHRREQQAAPRRNTHGAIRYFLSFLPEDFSGLIAVEPRPMNRPLRHGRRARLQGVPHDDAALLPTKAQVYRRWYCRRHVAGIAPALVDVCIRTRSMAYRWAFAGPVGGEVGTMHGAQISQPAAGNLRACSFDRCVAVATIPPERRCCHPYGAPGGVEDVGVNPDAQCPHTR